jgi:hypothetical protein
LFTSPKYLISICLASSKIHPPIVSWSR